MEATGPYYFKLVTFRPDMPHTIEALQGGPPDWIAKSRDSVGRESHGSKFTF
jgi:hypothetical protein